MCLSCKTYPLSVPDKLCPTLAGFEMDTVRDPGAFVIFSSGQMDFK